MSFYCLLNYNASATYNTEKIGGPLTVFRFCTYTKKAVVC